VTGQWIAHRSPAARLVALARLFMGALRKAGRIDFIETRRRSRGERKRPWRPRANAGGSARDTRRVSLAHIVSATGAVVRAGRPPVRMTPRPPVAYFYTHPNVCFFRAWLSTWLSNNQRGRSRVEGLFGI
jgi:hypothetical protein